MKTFSIRNMTIFRLCFFLLPAFAWLSVACEGLLQAQESVAFAEIQPKSKPHSDAVQRSHFFTIESLDERTRELSTELLLKALDSEAFYTLVGQIKPVSEGFWGGYFSVDRAKLVEIDQVRAALRPWNVPGLFFADVLVYESIQYGQRYASAYVVHLPSLKRLIEQHSEFFARWGITSTTPAAEVMMAIERSRQPDDRWRGFGRLFGYPEYAIDFFVAAGMHQRTTGEFIERDFRQIPTFGSRSGQFVFAVPKLGLLSPEDIQLRRRAAILMSEYRRLRPDYVAASTNPSGLLRDWMDDGTGACHPEHLIAKLPSKSDADLDAEIASWNKPETKPPEIKFNHLYLVLNQEDFEAVRNSDFLKNRLGASDQGFPQFLPVDDQCQSIYLRGQDTYLELLGPKNKFNEPVGKIGIGWTVEKVGDLDMIEKLLAKETPEDHSHVLNGDRISRRDFLESRYDATRILKNVTSLTIEIPIEAAGHLRADLAKLGWRGDEFDRRTWILHGPDFRVMLLVHPEATREKLKSIGFETNSGVDLKDPHRIGERIEVSFDGNDSGWIELKQDDSEEPR